MGVKEAGGNLGQITEIIQGTREDFLMYSVSDSDTPPGLARGGYGVISLASRPVGVQIKDMTDKFLNAQLRKQLRSTGSYYFW